MNQPANFNPIGIVASFVVLAHMAMTNDHWPSSEYRAIGFFLSAIVLGIFAFGTKRKLTRVPNSVFVCVVGLLIVFTADFSLRTWEARGPSIPLIGESANWLLWLFGYDSAFNNGLLHIDHSDGAVSILVSLEKTGIRWMILFLLIFGLFQFVIGNERKTQIAPKWRCWMTFGLAAVFLVIVRLLLVLSWYLESSEILFLSGGGEIL